MSDEPVNARLARAARLRRDQRHLRIFVVVSVAANVTIMAASVVLPLTGGQITGGEAIALAGICGFWLAVLGGLLFSWRNG